MIWKENIQELFEDEREGHQIEDLHSECGPDITKYEVLHAKGLAKNNKVPGPDQVTAEILKFVSEEQTYILVDLSIPWTILESIPNKWLQSTKKRQQKCIKWSAYLWTMHSKYFRGYPPIDLQEVETAKHNLDLGML